MSEAPLFASEHAQRARRGIDTVTFDMDGVLIDITRSIRQVNILAPAFYLREVLGWSAPDGILTSDDIERYKHAGGFNDDLPLTCAIVLLYLIKAQQYRMNDAEALNQLAPTHIQLAQAITERGGGLAAAEELLLSRIDPKIADSNRIQGEYNKPLIQNLFEEMFAGDLTERLYHRSRTLYYGRGLVYEDRCILDRGSLPQGKKLGMLTGRTYEESVIGRELCGLVDLLPDRVCVTKRDGFHKPDPGGLALLAERLETQTGGIYIGDTLDDMRTVRALNATRTHPPFLAALVLSGPAGRDNERTFQEAGADIIGADVNEVLQWLIK